MTGVESYIAESLEHKIKRILNNKEPIKDGAPLIYTERKDGVLPSYKINTDIWEHAIDAMDKVTQSVKELKSVTEKPIEFIDEMTMSSDKYKEWFATNEVALINSVHFSIFCCFQ